MSEADKAMLRESERYRPMSWKQMYLPVLVVVAIMILAALGHFVFPGFV